MKVVGECLFLVDFGGSFRVCSHPQLGVLGVLLFTELCNQTVRIGASPVILHNMIERQ